VSLGGGGDPGRDDRGGDGERIRAIGTAQARVHLDGVREESERIADGLSDLFRSVLQSVESLLPVRRGLSLTARMFHGAETLLGPPNFAIRRGSYRASARLRATFQSVAAMAPKQASPRSW